MRICIFLAMGAAASDDPTGGNADYVLEVAVAL
jgi:hypothetical protein